MSLYAETEYDDLLTAEPPVARRVPSQPSMALVTLFCAAAVGFALVGAAYAVDGPRGLGDAATKGDRLADGTAPAQTLTIEDANLDAGFSNLIQIPSDRPAVTIR